MPSSIISAKKISETLTYLETVTPTAYQHISKPEIITFHYWYQTFTFCMHVTFFYYLFTAPTFKTRFIMTKHPVGTVPYFHNFPSIRGKRMRSGIDLASEISPYQKSADMLHGL